MKSLERQRFKQTFAKTTRRRREDFQHRLGKLTRLDSNLRASVGQDLRAVSGELSIPSSGILIANHVCIEENFASSLPPVILLQSVYSRTANKFWKLGSSVLPTHTAYTHAHGSVQRTAAPSSFLSDSRSWINTKRKPWKRVHSS